MERILLDLIGNFRKHDNSNENGKKAIGASRFLVHFFAIVAQPRHETT